MDQQVIKVLEEIRDAVRGNSSRIDETNAKLDQTNARLDQTNARLDQAVAKIDQTNTRLDQAVAKIDQTNTRLVALEDRVTAIDLRLSTSIKEVASTLGTLTRLFEDRLDLRDRVGRCEVAIEELRRRP